MTPNNPQQLPRFRAWDGKEYIYSFTKDGKDRLGWFFSSVKANPNMIVEQSIEMVDKNGKEMFVGDIIQTSNLVPEVVKFEEGHVWVEVYVAYQTNPAYGYLRKVAAARYQILGNIHENPDELKRPARIDLRSVHEGILRGD